MTIKEVNSGEYVEPQDEPASRDFDNIEIDDLPDVNRTVSK